MQISLHLISYLQISLLRYVINLQAALSNPGRSLDVCILYNINILRSIEIMLLHSSIYVFSYQNHLRLLSADAQCLHQTLQTLGQTIHSTLINTNDGQSHPHCLQTPSLPVLACNVQGCSDHVQAEATLSCHLQCDRALHLLRNFIIIFQVQVSY